MEQIDATIRPNAEKAKDFLAARLGDASRQMADVPDRLSSMSVNDVRNRARHSQLYKSGRRMAVAYVARNNPRAGLGMAIAMYRRTPKLAALGGAISAYYLYRKMRQSAKRKAAMAEGRTA